MPPRAEPCDFRCRECNRWVRTSPWSRYAEAQACPRCFAAHAAELARHAAQVAAQRRGGQEQLELPDW